MRYVTVLIFISLILFGTYAYGHHLSLPVRQTVTRGQLIDRLSLNGNNSNQESNLVRPRFNRLWRENEVVSEQMVRRADFFARNNRRAYFLAVELGMRNSRNTSDASSTPVTNQDVTINK